MQSYLPLNFLQEKINRLQTALFFNLTSSLLRFPVSVIYVLKVDEAGQIWFCMPGPVHSVKEYDSSFLSHLQFFRKGESFYLKIQGKAFIVNDPEEINDVPYISPQMKCNIHEGAVTLVKVQIRYADYFENRPDLKKPNLKNIPMQLYNLLFKPYESSQPQRIVLLPFN